MLLQHPRAAQNSMPRSASSWSPRLDKKSWKSLLRVPLMMSSRPDRGVSAGEGGVSGSMGLGGCPSIPCSPRAPMAPPGCMGMLGDKWLADCSCASEAPGSVGGRLVAEERWPPCMPLVRPSAAPGPPGGLGPPAPAPGAPDVPGVAAVGFTPGACMLGAPITPRPFPPFLHTTLLGEHTWIHLAQRARGTLICGDWAAHCLLSSLVAGRPRMLVARSCADIGPLCKLSLRAEFGGQAFIACPCRVRRCALPVCCIGRVDPLKAPLPCTNTTSSQRQHQLR